MAEKSIMWTTGGAGDGASEYTQAEVIRWLRQAFVNVDDEGVHKNYRNELAAAVSAPNVAVNTGAAIVHGFPYWNTAAVDVNIPTPVGATRHDRIVLRAGWAAQTVRITRIAGAEGAGVPPNITQNDGVTWDIPLWHVSCTTGGAITLETNEREFLHPNVAVDENMLDASVAGDGLTGGDGDALEVNVDDATIEISGDALRIKDNGVDDTKCGNRVPQFYRRQGGSATSWAVAGSTDRTPTTVRMQAGAIVLSFVAAQTATVHVDFPVVFSNVPLIILSQSQGEYPGGTIAITLESFNVEADDFYIQGFSDGVITDSIIVNWLAIGPE